MEHTSLLQWDIYEIKSPQTEIHGVMLRGRIRKLGLEQGFNVLCENASDEENCVRFAVIHGESAEAVIAYVEKVIPQVHVSQILTTQNPVLSKLKVNKEERYTL